MNITPPPLLLVKGLAHKKSYPGKGLSRFMQCVQQVITTEN